MDWKMKMGASTRKKKGTAMEGVVCSKPECKFKKENSKGSVVKREKEENRYFV